jgi:predicted TIM-barrel fold metal-dependent hydrolase
MCFGPYARFPFASNRTYTPPEALAADYLAVAQRLRLQRFVVVQPSVFGANNRCSVVTAAMLDAERTRVVAVIDDDADISSLRALHAASVRAVRVNAFEIDAALPDRLQRVADRIAPLGWHLKLYTRGENLPAVAARMALLPVPLVLDHMARFPPRTGSIIRNSRPSLIFWRAEAGRSCVATRFPPGPSFTDLLAPARALLAAAPERCVWGSNWPHATPSGPRAIDKAEMLGLLADWCGDTALLRRVLVDNPARLYGF